MNTRLLHFILRRVNAKKIASRKFLHPHRSARLRIPGRLKKGYNTGQFLVKNRMVVTLESKNSSVSKHVFFLHGGAYAAEATAAHWRLIEDLVNRTFFKWSIIDYPLVPEHSHKEAHEMVLQAYARLAELHPDDDFFFLGDSAGGGFCLSVAQSLRNGQVQKRPGKIALLSPWIDISMSNPEIRELEQKDLLLNPEALLICSKRFADGLNLKDPAVSPLYGSMENLGSIGIFVGTHEILLPDCRRLKSKIEESGTEVCYKEYEAMQHDWMIFPIKEREILLDDVAAYLLA